MRIQGSLLPPGAIWTGVPPNVDQWGDFLTATSAYTAIEPGDLSFRPGESVVVLNRTTKYWWEVRKIGDGTRGLVPIDHFVGIITVLYHHIRADS